MLEIVSVITLAGLESTTTTSIGIIQTGVNRCAYTVLVMRHVKQKQLQHSDRSSTSLFASSLAMNNHTLSLRLDFLIWKNGNNNKTLSHKDSWQHYMILYT